MGPCGAYRTCGHSVGRYRNRRSKIQSGYRKQFCDSQLQICRNHHLFLRRIIKFRYCSFYYRKSSLFYLEHTDSLPPVPAAGKYHSNRLRPLQPGADGAGDAFFLAFCSPASPSGRLPSFPRFCSPSISFSGRCF